MSQPLKVDKNSPTNPLRQRVKRVDLHSETFWPAYVGADTSITKQKHPKVTIYELPNQQVILLEHEDGAQYKVPYGNCKGWEVWRD